jgi:hypothetical protein
MPAPDFLFPVPRTGPEIVAALRFHQAEAAPFFAALAPDTFLAPQGDRWSPCDHLRHLTKSMRAVTQGLGQPRPVLALLFGISWRAAARDFEALRAVYRGELDAGAQAGRFAPRPETPDDRVGYRVQVLERWNAAEAGLERSVGRWTETALDRYRLPHPVLGKLTVREMLFFTAYHNAHHARLVAGRLTSA